MDRVKLGEHIFPIGKRTYIMGILNVTPDSFSDGGKFHGVEAAVERALVMEREGADIIDIGGESTRPGHTPVGQEEELKRVLPVIEELNKRLRVPVSIDTSKAAVAEEAVRAGALMVNDVWGGRKDPEILEVIARTGAACCLMHNKERAQYEDLLKEVVDVLRKSAESAVQAGVREDRIILDPGIGFGKTVEDNIQIMRNLDRFNRLGYPWLLGTSRKSMIGKTLDLPAEERVEGTLATTVIGIYGGCSFIRVHDVKENYRAASMADRIIRGEEKDG
ncbi:MAG: dihydropteroate synthase [Spirochaetia bacterium]